MVMALKPLHDAFAIRRVVVATYQSTSGGGKAKMDELFNQTRGIYVNDTVVKQEFTKQIAFNVIPHIDAFMDDGSTKEGMEDGGRDQEDPRPRHQGDGDVRAGAGVHRPCRGRQHRVRAAALGGGRAAPSLDEAPGVLVVDHRADEGYVTPVEAVGEDAVYVSRIREDPTVDNGLNLWVVSDNLRKGAALNAIQIAELMIEDYLAKAA